MLKYRITKLFPHVNVLLGRSPIAIPPKASHLIIKITPAVMIIPPELFHQTTYFRYPSNCQLKKYKLLRSIGTFPGEATLLFSFYRPFQ